MTTTSKPESHRRLDVAHLVLLLVGLITGVAGAVLVTAGELNVFFTVPSIVAVVSGATHLTKREAPHR